MDRLVINGGRKLEGEVNISGAKNAALPILAATILADSPCTIHNVPKLVDIEVMCALLKEFGAKIQREKDTIIVDPVRIKKFKASYDLVRRMRASICVLGPLLGRLGQAEISMPGGCVIGPRPIDLHIKGIRSLGVDIKIEHGYIVAKTKRLRGAEIYLGGRYGSSVLATANVMMAAVRADGITVIENAACEPEIDDLANFLNTMGAQVAGAGSPRIIIKGCNRLNGCEYHIIPDRIEAGTYILAGAITRGEVVIKRAEPTHLNALIDKVLQANIKVKVSDKKIYVKGNRRISPVDIVTSPYPGFPTDLQAQFMALMCIADGLSIITEKVFPERFIHIPELNRMAADISLEGSTAIIKGVKKLSGAPVMASDLRASAALVLAGLTAEGQTIVTRIYHLDRGYENLTNKLRKLGANVKRVS